MAFLTKGQLRLVTVNPPLQARRTVVTTAKPILGAATWELRYPCIQYLTYYQAVKPTLVQTSLRGAFIDKSETTYYKKPTTESLKYDMRNCVFEVARGEAR